MRTPNGDTPAFPQPFIHEPDKGQYGQYTQACDVGHGGLTKREEMAKAAMQGIMSNPYLVKEIAEMIGGGETKTGACEGVAASAVDYADALLAELEKKQ